MNIKAAVQASEPTSHHPGLLLGPQITYPQSGIPHTRMARLTLSFLISLSIYFAYQALASEALSTSGTRSSSSSSAQSARTSETMENLLGRDDKLPSVWYKNAYNRRSAAGPIAPGHIGTYAVLQRSPSGPMGPKLPLAYVADINFIDDEDVEKRFDDYGHMRFGKRGGGGEGEQFDDYGHMRFGRRRRR